MHVYAKNAFCGKMDSKLSPGVVETMSVQAQELKRLAEKVLSDLGVTDYSELQLTYALKTEGKWRVSFDYGHSGGFASSTIRKIGSFAVDVKSGEVEGMWLDRSWK
jgi:hypothetical protein